MSTEQVFGPGRASAAHAAISELAQAEAAREQNPWSEATHARLIKARRVRAMYYEYGDIQAALEHA